jgi:hypothetical protein
MLRPRNFVARSPLLCKGGVHERSQSGKRQQQKQAMEQEINDIKILDEEQEDRQRLNRRR